MKIAIFHNLPSGGAKRALYNNVDFLAREHEIDVFVPSTANEDYLSLKEIVNNLNTFEVKNTFIGFLFSSIKYFPDRVALTDLEKTQKKIAEAVNKEDYDVVFCEQDRYTMAPFFLKYLKKPHVYYCQQSIIFRELINRNLFKKAGLGTKNDLRSFRLKLYGSRMINMDKKVANYSRYTVVNSYFSHESILRTYGQNSFVSYLGVDTELFKPLNISKENFVLSVGHCLPEKGFEFIIKSLSKIDSQIRPELVIVSDQGNIQWQSYLKNLASELNVQLRILNLITDDELVLLYNQAKMVVYAPYLEPFGLVPLEAMSCGTPVVGVKEGGVRESVKHDHTGMLTERDEESFSKEITNLLLDPNKTEKLAKNSIKVVNDLWTLKNSGKRLLNHLNRAIDCYNE
ncbi:MAG: glycosyltransferase [Methanobacterium sp. Maddingley MBC34]|nr:MAG: glycosyltransferase [Methanobacterium sp. Maddingley MBC34]